MGDLPDRPGGFATSRDALLGGRLNLRQPVKGHRVGSDAILLAAAAPAEGVGRLIDVGAGVGAVGLAIVQRLSGASADLVERDADLAALASENATLNGLAARTRVACVDIARPGSPTGPPISSSPTRPFSTPEACASRPMAGGPARMSSRTKLPARRRWKPGSSPPSLCCAPAAISS
jgi:hypothetical protein